VQVPFFFKSIIDSLNIPVAELSAEQTAWTLVGSLIVGCASGSVLIEVPR
jgi:ABC transporter ATM